MSRSSYSINVHMNVFHISEMTEAQTREAEDEMKCSRAATDDEFHYRFSQENARKL